MKKYYIITSFLLILLIIFISLSVIKLTTNSYENVEKDNQVVEYYVIEDNMPKSTHKVYDYDKALINLLDFKIIDSDRDIAQKKQNVFDNNYIDIKVDDKFDKIINDNLSGGDTDVRN